MCSVNACLDEIPSLIVLKDGMDRGSIPTGWGSYPLVMTNIAIENCHL